MASSLLDKSLADVRRETTTKPVFGKAKPAPSAAPAANPPPANVNDRWTHDMYSANERGPRRAAPAPTPATSELGGSGRGPNLLIFNLQYEVSERELEALFGQIGRIEKGPLIKFDISGRSKGEAFIGYENEGFAEQAMKAFNGAPAKGEPIDLRYTDRPPLWARKQLGDSGNVLLGRIEGGRERRRGTAAPYQPPLLRSRDGISSRGSSRGARGGGDSFRSLGRGRGGRGSDRGGRGGRESGPKTAADLDKELEAFMTEPGKGGDEDVKMDVQD